MPPLHEEPDGLLRVSAPASMGSLAALVAEYLLRYPDVEVDMVCTDRSVDLIEERFDLAIRVGALADSTTVARKIGVGRRLLVASPGYCEQYGEPASPGELRSPQPVALRRGGRRAPEPSDGGASDGNGRLAARGPRWRASYLEGLGCSRTRCARRERRSLPRTLRRSMR